MWTLVNDPAALNEALKLARGCYQRNLLLGFENLSGSSLRGKAGRYRGKYAISRNNLLDRLSAKEVPFKEIKGPHNARILVLG